MSDKYATVGPIAAPDTCDMCGEPTKDSAICAPCAWHRYDDELAEWNETLREDVASWTEEAS